MSAPQSPQWLFLRDEHSPLAVSLMHFKGWEIHGEHANLQYSLLLGGVKGKMQIVILLVNNYGLVSTQVNRALESFFDPGSRANQPNPFSHLCALPSWVLFYVLQFMRIIILVRPDKWAFSQKGTIAPQHLFP